MTDFTNTVKESQTFYVMAGTAAATLIGLLFMAVSINIDVFRRRTSEDIQHFAALTFNCFFYVLLISMLFLIPRSSPVCLGTPLLLLEVLGLFECSGSKEQVPERKRPRPPEHGWKIQHADRLFVRPGSLGNRDVIQNRTNLLRPDGCGNPVVDIGLPERLAIAGANESGCHRQNTKALTSPGFFHNTPPPHLLLLTIKMRQS
jgi:hypothetical protein